MKLSEAVALGRMLVIPAPGGILFGDGRGCALGMAAVARGLLSSHAKKSQNSYNILTKEWPWLRGLNEKVCNCPFWGTGNPLQVIGHLFDHHVVGVKDWTLDELIDWIRKNEPAEEEAPVAAEEPRVLAAK